MVDTSLLKSGDVFGALGISGLNFGALGMIILWIVIILIVGVILAVLIIWWVNRRMYNQDVWIFGKVAGVPMFKYADKGKLMSFGMAGDKLMKLKKIKKFISPPKIQMGRNLFWLYEREDGELINFSMVDLDEMQKKAGAYYVDTDMRMQRLGIEKNLKERLEKIGFFAKYGSTIAGIIFVIMVTVALVVLFTKIKDVSISIDGMAGNVGAMADAVAKFYSTRIGESPADLPSQTGIIPALLLPLWSKL